jgi:hypothetical protein
MKYPPLLSGILEHTPKSHPDYDSLGQALALIKKSIGNINEEKRKLDAAMVPSQNSTKANSNRFRFEFWRPKHPISQYQLISRALESHM